MLKMHGIFYPVTRKRLPVPTGKILGVVPITNDMNNDTSQINKKQIYYE